MLLNRKYDSEKETFLLDGKYLFAYSYSDGFTEHLLWGELAIDFDYKCIIAVSAFPKKPYYQEFEDIPESIKNYVELLLNSNYNVLKNDYNEGHRFGDSGKNEVFINLDAQTKYISIDNFLPDEFFMTETEKLLHEFCNYMKGFFEGIYKNDMLKK